MESRLQVELPTTPSAPAIDAGTTVTTPATRATRRPLFERVVPARFRQAAWWRLETGLVVAATAAGLLSAVLSHAHQLSIEERLRDAYATREVLVAARDLPAGAVLDRGALKTGRALGATLSANVMTPDNEAMVIGRSVTVAMKIGDPLLLSAVQGVSDAKDIAEKIPPGRRLFTLTIDGKATGYGFVNPNDHVDILATMDLPGRGPVTFLLEDDVTIVSVGARSVLSPTGRIEGTDVSFFVTPEQFEMLAFAQKRGSFSLSLRNPRDVGAGGQEALRRGMDLNRFLDNRSVAPASGGGALKVVEGDKVSVQNAPGSHQ